MLSISKGVFSYEYPNSINARRRLIPILAFAYATAISAFDTAPIIFLNILASACIRVLISYYYILIGFDLSCILPKK